MSNLWEYEPKNLLTVRLFETTKEGIPNSWGMWRHGTWPSSGYREAVCFPNSIGFGFEMRTAGEHPIPQHLHGNQVPHPMCACGLYGSLDSEFLVHEYSYCGTQYPTALVENAGSIIIHKNSIVRAERQQVVAMIKGENAMEFSKYFNVPIIEPDQAQEMINKQMEKWEVVL